MSEATREAMSEGSALDIVDVDVGGDLSRVILGGVTTPPGATMGARSAWLEAHGDGLRQALLSPPLGAPEMCADLVTPAVDPRAGFGFIIMESMGYPAMSGSNAMAVATALIEAGLVRLCEPLTELVLEAPAGLVPLRAACRKGRIEAVTYATPSARIIARNQPLDIDDGRRLSVAIVDAGVVFAAVAAADLGLTLEADETDRLAAFGARIAGAANRQLAGSHALPGAPARFDFVLFRGPLTPGTEGLAAAIAVFVSPSVICRCPTGTGSTAALALLRAEGALAAGAALETRSPRGSRFTARYRDGDPAAVEITGRPEVRGRSRLALDAPFSPATP